MSLDHSGLTEKFPRICPLLPFYGVVADQWFFIEDEMDAASLQFNSKVTTYDPPNPNWGIWIWIFLILLTFCGLIYFVYVLQPYVCLCYLFFVNLLSISSFKFLDLCS